ncbi:MAG: hypothetical protein ACLUEK_08310 [Oscillospiraceae bacterium]
MAKLVVMQAGPHDDRGPGQPLAEAEGDAVRRRALFEVETDKAHEYDRGHGVRHAFEDTRQGGRHAALPRRVAVVGEPNEDISELGCPRAPKAEAPAPAAAPPLAPARPRAEG